jgi:hypothetical protein
VRLFGAKSSDFDGGVPELKTDFISRKLLNMKTGES